MSDDLDAIQPKPVPLSHTEASKHAAGAQGKNRTAQRWIGGALLAVAAAVLGLVFFVVPQWIEPAVVQTNGATTVPPASDRTAPAPGGREELPPYQQLLRQQARQQAQDELARFVELQLQLEEQMQVGEWGADDYDRAKTHATEGDEQFLAEQFEASIASYQTASNALAGLIQQGEALLDAALTAGHQALEARDPERARVQFSKALVIDPNDSAAQQGSARAQLLPQINVLLRRAKNHELSGEFDQALKVYEEVRTLDPETFGLAEAIETTQRGDQQNRVNNHLSDGFRALDGGRLSVARSAFNKALALDPQNAVARGGLEQVADKSTNVEIDELRRRALAAEATEDWQTAANHYAAVLKVDGNIQFARDGRQRAAAQQRAANALRAILAAPDKLSSAQLYREAEQFLADARGLTPQGPKLTGLLTEANALLRAYRDPVPVTLLSDNETQVTLSTVGRLGSFERKQVSLRPGAYTLVGSRDGCRDVRQNVVVRPNMSPIDIRCLEQL